jgi:hypothetical protein
MLWMVHESAVCQLRLRRDVCTAQGLADTAKVSDVLNLRAQLYQAPLPVVHSATYSNPWWALGGLHVRSTVHSDAREQRKEKPPQESTAVQANGLRFPASTQWQTPRAWTWAVLAALLAWVCWVAAGAFLLGPEHLAGQHWWQLVVAGTQELPAVAAANAGFAAWQTAWFVAGQAPTHGLARWHSPPAAVLADFGLILAYGYLLGCAVGWAFARVARLRRVGDAVRDWLNCLGMAAPVAVGGDLLENLFTLALLSTAPSQFVPAWDYLLGFAMSLASAGKWLGLAGCALLVVWGCLASGRAPTPHEAN